MVIGGGIMDRRIGRAAGREQGIEGHSEDREKTGRTTRLMLFFDNSVFPQHDEQAGNGWGMIILSCCVLDPPTSSVFDFVHPENFHAGSSRAFFRRAIWTMWFLFQKKFGAADVDIHQ